MKAKKGGAWRPKGRHNRSQSSHHQQNDAVAGETTTAILRAAQRLSDNGREEEALAMVRPLTDAITAGDRENFLYSRRLLAFAYCQSGQCHQACEYARVAADLCPESLDFQFILTIALARQHRYKEALECGARYLDLWRAKAEEKSVRGIWDATYPRRHQLLNAYGVALLENDRPREAEAVFRDAMAQQSNFDSSYINLSILLAGQGRMDEAAQVIAAGLQVVPDSEELRRLAATTGRQATISVCMIVKDEEAFLPRCLASVRNFADEIILVDTGSQDTTLAIAGQFDCRVFHHEWQGDFSAARNFSLEKATKDWVFIIDADEELPETEIPKLRYYVSQPDVQIVSLSVFNTAPDSGQISSFLPSMRLFRRSLNLRYYGIVHNRLRVPSEIPVTRSQARLYHYGYDLPREILEKKKARTMALLEKQLADHPDDVYVNFNMAQLLRGFTDANSEAVSRRIMEHAGRVIANPESKTRRYFGQRVMALHQKATALYALQQYDEAAQCCREALENKPGYLDALMTLGHIGLGSNRPDMAGTYYRQYLDERGRYNADDETDNIILLYLDGIHMAWYGLGLVAESENDLAEAIRCFRNVLTAREPYLDTYLRLGRLLLCHKKPVPAEELYRREAEREDTSGPAWFGLGEALTMQGREAVALTYYQRAIDLAPDNANYLFGLGKTYLRTGQPAEAAKYFQEMAGVGTDAIALLFAAGNLLFEAGAFDEAETLYGRVLDQKPDYAEARLNQGNSQFRSGRFEAACATYEQVVRACPDYATARRNLGVVKARMGKTAEALEELSRYTGQFPTDAEATLLAGDLSSAAGRDTEATSWYEAYLRLRPRDDAGWVRLAEAYLRLGFTEAARPGFEKALSLNPACEFARQRLAELADTACTVSP